MNISRRSPSVEEYKIKASLLLKSLRANDPNAAKRFKRLPEFANFSIADILQADIRRKQALLFIAVENGFASWLDLKMQVNFIVGGFLNSWFSNYLEAKSHLDSRGGYLLPYKNQYFICNDDYMKQIGFDPNDPDWKLIEYDWVAPRDKRAWQRLYAKWSQSKGGSHE